MVIACHLWSLLAKEYCLEVAKFSAVISCYKPQERPLKPKKHYSAFCWQVLLKFWMLNINDLKRQNVGTFDKLISNPVVHSKEELLALL